MPEAAEGVALRPVLCSSASSRFTVRRTRWERIPVLGPEGGRCTEADAVEDEAPGGG